MLKCSAITVLLMMTLGSVVAEARTVTVSAEVRARGQRTCYAHLHVDSQAAAPPVALSLQGTGIYSTADARHVDPALRKLIVARRLAVLTLDKPGIGGDAADEPRVDDAIYNLYTQDDLLACAQAALEWARTAAPVKLAAALYLSGHSEGSQVLTRLYREMLRDAPQRARDVRMLVLSGLPMSDWREMLEGQLTGANKERFWDGFRQRSDGVLRAFGGLTFAYLTQVFAQEPLRKTLESLWGATAKAPVRVFQGLRDRNTPAAAVMAFEALNQARRTRGLAALDFQVRYYEAGHGLNAQAVDDIAADIERDLAPTFAANRADATVALR